MKDTKQAASNDNTENQQEPKESKKKKQSSTVEMPDQQTITAKYKFSEKEKVELADKLAQRQIEFTAAKEEKKAAMASFSDKVERINLDIQKFSRAYKDGYEHRDYNVKVIYDYKKREKRFKDVETKKIVEVLPFAPGDEQRRFV